MDGDREGDVKNASDGLSAEEARRRLAAHGANAIPEPRTHPLLGFARKFSGLSAWMIESIAVISLILQKWPDFWIALGLLLVNAVLSFFQERRASAAVTALRERLQVSARALRDRTWQVIPAQDLVPGDVVRLRGGISYLPIAVSFRGICGSTSRR